MRPVSVRFQCFGPYMQEQYINFEALEKDGIFLICGETGAGKTTILDAICYALYGKSSGGLRGGLEVMRCALAGSDDDTLVEFVFDSGGKRYRFTRSLKYKTEKNKKSRNLNDYHNCMQLDGDREIPIIEKEQDRYVTQKAQELIGLTYEQFRQVIILPQGQFERLLVSDSEQKEEILVSLFHAERWQKMADELYNRVSDRDKHLKEERRNIDALLQQYGCENLTALSEQNVLQKGLLEELLQQTRQAEQEEEAAKNEKERALLENQAFQELKKREFRLASLQEKQSAVEAQEALLADANRAEAIRPRYRENQSAAAALEKAEIQNREAERTLVKRQDALQQLRQEQHKHQQARSSIDADRQRIVLLDSAAEAYETLEARKAAVEKAESAQNAASIAAEKKQTIFTRCAAALQRAVDAQNAAIAAYQRIQEQYLLGIGATLARELQPGKPCPVCGSLEHPEPAGQEGTHITEQELNAALKAMHEAGEQVGKALKDRTRAEEERQQAGQVLSEAQRQMGVAKTAYQEALSQRIPGIDTQQQRLQQRKLLELRIQQYDREDRELQEKLAAALGAEEAARGIVSSTRQTLAQAQQDAAEAEGLWKTALENSGLETLQRYLAADMEPEEKQRRSGEVLRFRAELASAQQAAQEQRTALMGKTAPDLSAVSKRLSDAEDHHRKCVTAQTLAAKQLEDMTKAQEQLTRRLADYELQRTGVDGDLAFARRLRGDSGISLQRYVLGVMMTSVTVEANRLLAGVYRGRYRLYRTDEISGRRRKGGLELEVYDAHTNQRRSVTTLSGGEKFLVSLSLAIGLSAVVQAQGGGIRLEAMFIDEGFGSLDRESVADALEVLQGIRRGSGIVGIISHVEQLSEVIPTRLEISKGKKGSVCTLRG